MTSAGRPRIGRAINLTVPEAVVAAARATAERETAGWAKVTTSAVLRRWLIAGAEARKDTPRAAGHGRTTP